MVVLMQLTRDRAAELASWSGRLLLDLVLPPQCPTCDAIVDEAGRFCFDVALRLPLRMGRGVRYRGWLTPL